MTIFAFHVVSIKLIKCKNSNSLFAVIRKSTHLQVEEEWILKETWRRSPTPTSASWLTTSTRYSRISWSGMEKWCAWNWWPRTKWAPYKVWFSWVPSGMTLSKRSTTPGYVYILHTGHPEPKNSGIPHTTAYFTIIKTIKSLERHIFGYNDTELWCAAIFSDQWRLYCFSNPVWVPKWPRGWRLVCFPMQRPKGANLWEWKDLKVKGTPKWLSLNPKDQGLKLPLLNLGSASLICGILSGRYVLEKKVLLLRHWLI